jgi:hypothetical protein
MSAHDEIQKLLALYETEHAKFEAGVAVAGTRARNALSALTKAVKARRDEIMATKNSRKADKA